MARSRGRRGGRRATSSPLVGRRAELARLDDRLELPAPADGPVVAIAAEAGMGKSRLVAEFVRNARRRGLLVAFGECQAFGTTTSYLAWREVWRRCSASRTTRPAERQRERRRTGADAIDPALLARAPLLESVVGVPIPDNDLTAAFDPKLRKASLEDLL